MAINPNRFFFRQFQQIYLLINVMFQQHAQWFTIQKLVFDCFVEWMLWCSVKQHSDLYIPENWQVVADFSAQYVQQLNRLLAVVGILSSLPSLNVPPVIWNKFIWLTPS